MSNICKFVIFSYLQKFTIFMKWVWKIRVDHNKTDHGSIGSISKVTNKLYTCKIASILHTEKVFHVQIYCIFHNCHGQIAPKWPKCLSPSPWQPYIDTKPNFDTCFRVFASRGTSGANFIKIWDMPFPNYFGAWGEWLLKINTSEKKNNPHPTRSEPGV